jgi:hypothetical protein
MQRTTAAMNQPCNQFGAVDQIDRPDQPQSLAKRQRLVGSFQWPDHYILFYASTNKANASDPGDNLLIR